MAAAQSRDPPVTLLLTLFLARWAPGAKERCARSRPGVFEIRVAVGVDPVSGRTVQRSFWFHGAREDAEERRRELAAQFAEYRSIRRAAPFLTVGELLERWVAGPHDWRPSTWVGVGPTSRRSARIPSPDDGWPTLRPEVVRLTMARWRETGARVSVVSGRFRVLRSAVGWAQSESIIDRNPIRDMRGPPRPGTRMHVPDRMSCPDRDVRAVWSRRQRRRGTPVSSLKALHKAEQVRLLTRLAADSGARRGELARSIQRLWTAGFCTIERGSPASRSVPPRPSGYAGSPWAGLPSNCGEQRRDLAATSGARRPTSVRGCSPGTSITGGVSPPSRLGHWFAELCAEAGLGGVSLHRLRHTVATFLVAGGTPPGATTARPSRRLDDPPQLCPRSAVGRPRGGR